jgi:hypothetical protein
MSSVDDDVVWSSRDPCPAVRVLLRQHNGDIDKAIALICSKSCSYQTARQCADALAHCMDLTPAEFIRRWRAIR